MWPIPVQSASHRAKIPARIVKDASVTGRSLVASAGASALWSTTLTVPISSSPGLLGNPPVFSLLVTSCSTNQGRQLGRALGNLSGWGGVIIMVMYFCFADALIQGDWHTWLIFLSVLKQSRAWTLYYGWLLISSDRASGEADHITCGKEVWQAASTIASLDDAVLILPGSLHQRFCLSPKTYSCTMPLLCCCSLQGPASLLLWREGDEVSRWGGMGVVTSLVRQRSVSVQQVNYSCIHYFSVSFAHERSRHFPMPCCHISYLHTVAWDTTQEQDWATFRRRVVELW